MQSKLFRIFVDLDDVLADFFSAACKAHEIPPEDFPVDGTWGMLNGLESYYDRPITLEQFWTPINARGIGFWRDLEPTPFGLDLLKLLARCSCEDVYVLTSPGPTIDSYVGKISWLKKQFSEVFRNFIITEFKHFLASPTSILIDDREEMVDKFTQAGGMGITFPARGNSLHSWRDKPLEHVERMLRRAEAL